jgi:hypothetical protein
VNVAEARWCDWAVSFDLIGLFASTSKCQVATILEIKPHQQSEAATSDLAGYDVSVKVGETIYVASPARVRLLLEPERE